MQSSPSRITQVSAPLLLALQSALRDASLDSTLSFTITKRDLRELSRWELEFVKNHTVDYLRNGAKLRPKSFEHFLSAKKYEDSCYVYVIVGVKELTEIGLLRVESVGGRPRWVLGDTVLDPAGYRKLYASTKETLVELADFLGVLEVLNTFAEIPSDPRGIIKYEFTYGGLRFSLDLYGSPHLVGRAEIKRKAVDGVNAEVDVWAFIERPTVRDVLGLVSFAGTDAVLHVLDAARTVVESVERQTGGRVVSASATLDVDLSNWNITGYTLSVGLTLDAGGQYRVNYSVSKRSRNDDVLDISVYVSRSLVSPIFASTLALLHDEYDSMKYEVNGVEVTLSVGKNSEITAETRLTETAYWTGTLPAPRVPDITKLVKVLEDPVYIVGSYIAKRAEDLRSGRYVANPHFRRYVYSPIKRDLVSFHEARMLELNDIEILREFKWGTETSKDEILVKLALLATATHESLVHVLASQLYADGVLEGDEAYVAVKKPVNVLVKLVASGRLRASGGKLYLDGAEVEVPERYWFGPLVVADVLAARAPPHMKTGVRVKA